MNLKILSNIVLIVGVAAIPSLGGEPLEMVSQCVRPLKPLKFADNREVERYNFETQHYKMCIDTFIARHKENIQNSTDAINNTVKEWNSFVSASNANKEPSPAIQGKTGVSEGGSHTVGHSDPTRFTTGFSF